METASKNVSPIKNKKIKRRKKRKEEKVVDNLSLYKMFNPCSFLFFALCFYF